MPPWTGVPTPGASEGSTTSRSKLTCSPAAPVSATSAAPRAPPPFQRLACHRLHTTTINIAHRKHMHANLAQQPLLAGIEVTRADDNDALRINFRARPTNSHQSRFTQSGERGEDHAVNIARRGRV